MMRDRDDRQLVIPAACGDQAAFAELVRRYRDMVYGYCYHRTENFEDARDLAQDTFVRAYTRLSQLRDASRLGPWLRKIAANLCNRWAQRRRELPAGDIEVPKPPAESPNVAFVREALSSLPDNERLAVVLHYVDGLSYSDIAGFLEVSESAIRGRLHRGRERLKAEVLIMTEDTLGAHRLDEEFVVKAVNAAALESADAYNMRGDKNLSRAKADEAADLINKSGLGSVKDPVALADALLLLGSRELVLGDRDRAHEHWRRAKSLMEQSGDASGIERWRATAAYEQISDGNLAAARAMYSRAADYWLNQEMRPFGGEWPDMAGYIALATCRALEALGLDADWNLVADFKSGGGSFVREDTQTLHEAGAHIGFTKEGYPARLANVPGPLFGPTPLPMVLIRNQPQVGDRLRFVNPYVNQGEESVLESLSEIVTTPAGNFADCARSVSRIFAADKWEGEVVATRKLWFAPGVGIVKMAYQATGEPEDTSELVAFHVQMPSSDYVPLSVGNWWKWRWIEGEEQLGFRTETHREIVTAGENRWALLQYVFAVKN